MRLPRSPAPNLCARKGRATPEVGEKFIKVWNDYNDFINENKTDDLSGSQPTKGNIRGGP